MSTGMRPWIRAAFTVLGLAVLAFFAYEPLLRAGFVASDYRVLVEVGESLPDDAAESVQMPPLARASVHASRALWGIDDHGFPSSAFLHRLENVVLLILAAVGLALFTRRLLLPWTGSEHAGHAAFAAALLLGFHPLCSAAVAGIAGRGELLGLVLGVWSGATFLRGRQDRKIGFTTVAFVLCGLGGFTSDLILGLPLLLASAEFLSAHRYRSVRGRLRTTATTLTVFGAAAFLDLIFHVSRRGTEVLPPAFRALGDMSTEADVAAQLTRAIEKVGLLVLPSNFQVLGIAGTALVGVAFLVAMQPALVAARTAPRLWSWFLFGWLTALVVTELLHAHVRVAPSEIFLARVLLPSAAVMSVGLGIAVTALSGVRRHIFPWAVALAYAVVAHGNAKPWRAAADAADDLRTDLVAALEEHGTESSYLVIDPPVAIRGVQSVGESLRWLVHPALAGDEGPEEGTGWPIVRGLSRAAFLALVREPEFQTLLVENVVLLGPLFPVPTGEDAPRRSSVRLGPGDPSGGPRAWRDDLGSPAINLNPLQTSVVEVTAKAGTDLTSLEAITWTSTGGAAKRLARAGVWFEDREEPFGVYDLGQLLAWRLSDRIRGLYFEGGARPLSLVEVREELSPLRAGLQAEVEDRSRTWVFAPVTNELVLAHVARGRFVLGLLALDLDHLRHVELDVERSADGVLRARIPDRGRARELLDGDAPLAWTLEFRVEGRAVARSRGRIAAEDR